MKKIKENNKLIPDDIRDIIEEELPFGWLEEKVNEVNDYVRFDWLFDAATKPKYEVHSILSLHARVRPTPKMEKYLTSICEKALELSTELYATPKWVSGGKMTLHAKPRVHKLLLTQEHKDKVFDPRNYIVDLTPNSNPFYDNIWIREEEYLDTYKKIFGDVIIPKRVPMGGIK